ncbi:3',5'-cyclic-nucleotide phosphodiesterase pde1 [Saxophila tyrrhenica]|uniref:3',5'-cyclic-nucleotide phosphodiesterase pde1 n=1 Tax=Saxophila tyrrhenica TaxID=1690608 RepID=A0AAV9NYU3_9PEZI|nr:3',5'-cyclic-nucleotide phosphodiesterase pde1 [Saxophila tyrrhenica]
MKDKQDETADANTGLHGHRPALQVICLGSGGGPSEEDVTGFLVRSIASDWAKGSLLAVDAGSHLAPITRILERDFPSVSGGGLGNGKGVNGSTPELRQSLARASLSPSPEDEEIVKPEPTVLAKGPFAGLKFPNESARANALHVIRNYVNTYLITHPHLDHLSGFAINTAAFHATSRPKTLAALPSTVDAVKQHIFNDVIWPNLSDEDGGVGFVTFQRLKEGGDAMVGEGEGRGYIDVSDGLGVRAFKISHGVCTKSPPSHHHRGSIAGISDLQPPHNGSFHGEPASMTRTVSMSQNSVYSAPGTPGLTPRQSFYTPQQPSPRMAAADANSCVVDSTAFFVRDTESHREVLMFGDVEPDSISLSPRTLAVWKEAAHKIAHGLLGGIFIECSYDDSQADAFLFGHLNPRHLIAELQTLAYLVQQAKHTVLQEKGAKKRKRSGPNGSDVARHAISESDRKRSRSLASRGVLARDQRRGSVPDQSMPDAGAMPPSRLETETSSESLDQVQLAHLEPVSPKAVQAKPLPHPAAGIPSKQGGTGAGDAGVGRGDGGGGGVADPPLTGIKVVIIHIKDTMKDGPHVRDNVLAQLRDYEEVLEREGQGLGCEFVVARSGENYWF